MVVVNQLGEIIVLNIGAENQFGVHPALHFFSSQFFLARRE